MSDDAMEGYIPSPDGTKVPIVPPDHGKASNSKKALVFPDGSMIGQPLGATTSALVDDDERVAKVLGGKVPPMFTQRLDAYALYASGERPATIAQTLGVSPQLVSKWKRVDEWERRLSEARTKAAKASDFMIGNLLAEAVTLLRSKVKTRVMELELLCGTTTPPAIRLGAIKTWLELSSKMEAELLKNQAKADPDPGEAGRVPPIEITGLGTQG